MTTHELLGRKTEQHENLLSEYHNLLNLVRRIKSGEVDIKQVEITNDGWSIVDAAVTEKPSEGTEP